MDYFDRIRDRINRIAVETWHAMSLRNYDLSWALKATDIPVKHYALFPYWQFYAESGAGTLFAFQPDAAVVLLCNTFYYPETET